MALTTREDLHHTAAFFRVPSVVLLTLLPFPALAQVEWQPCGTDVCVTGGNVGVGTTAPGALLEVSGGLIRALATESIARPATGKGLELEYDPVTDQSVVRSYDRSSAGRRPLTLSASAFVLSGGNVGIGTTAPQYKLAVNGSIGTKEIVVTNSGWADYVFKPGYKLASLSQIKAYIGENQRLPGIPSEEDVKEKGARLGEMQVKLLAKIEELTLHLIQMDERNNQLEQQNRDLREQNRAIKNRIATLESKFVASGGRASLKRR